MASCPVCALSAIIDGLEAENAALKADRLALAMCVLDPEHNDSVDLARDITRRVIAEAEGKEKPCTTD